MRAVYISNSYLKLPSILFATFQKKWETKFLSLWNERWKCLGRGKMEVNVEKKLNSFLLSHGLILDKIKYYTGEKIHPVCLRKSIYRKNLIIGYRNSHPQYYIIITKKCTLKPIIVNIDINVVKKIINKSNTHRHGQFMLRFIVNRIFILVKRERKWEIRMKHDLRHT